MASSPAVDASAVSRLPLVRLRALRPAILLAVALVILPFAGGDFLAYQIALFLIYGIATQGVALCWGRLGFLPLGHGLFFGLGAYLTGTALKVGAQSPVGYLYLVPGLLVPAALAWVIAKLVFARSLRSGPYFSLITLAMTMLGFLAAQQWSDVTGGFNGMGDIPEPPGTDRFTSLYWLIAAVAVGTTFVLGVLVTRPIGVLWSAIAQNEDRMQLLGYATDRLKAEAFALSALLAAIAGGLFAAHQGIVTPGAMSFVLSTEFVIWAAVGGKASPLGALLGAVLVGYASAELREVFSSWEVIVGLVFIAIVRFLPDGLAGLISTRLGGDSLVHAASVPKQLAPASHAPAQIPTLVFDDVRSTAGGVRILNGLTFQLEGPGIRAVIGPNGAGKTSAFNAMTGRLPVTGGRIRVGGVDITGDVAWRVARRGVGRKLQVPSIFPMLSVRQNLAVALWASRLGVLDRLSMSPFGWTTPLLDELLEFFPDLAADLDTPAGRLSQGHRQALEFALTVLPEPHLLLLDEPCAGLSPSETRRMIEAIQRAVHRLGAGALLIEHDLTAVAALEGDVYVLHQGRLLARGPLATIQADPSVREVYAGARK